LLEIADEPPFAIANDRADRHHVNRRPKRRSDGLLPICQRGSWDQRGDCRREQKEVLTRHGRA
jgi:hypothetical protein